jgi:hypothetical protein
MGTSAPLFFLEEIIMFDYRILPDTTIDILKQEWRDEVSNAVFEDGEHDTGTIANFRGKDIVWFKLTLPTETDAWSYLQKHHIKHTAPIAVRFEKDGAYHWMIGGWCQ